MAEAAHFICGSSAICPHHICDLNRIHDILTQFGENRLNNDLWAVAVFFSNYKMVATASSNVSHGAFFDMTDASFSWVAPIQQKSARISWIVMNWQQNLRLKMSPSCFSVTTHFWHDSFVLCQSCQVYILTKFGEDWSTSNEMTKIFRNSRWRQRPSWNLVIMRFWREHLRSISDSQRSHQILWGLVQIVKKWQHFL